MPVYNTANLPAERLSCQRQPLENGLFGRFPVRTHTRIPTLAEAHYPDSTPFYPPAATRGDHASRELAIREDYRLRRLKTKQTMPYRTLEDIQRDTRRYLDQVQQGMSELREQSQPQPQRKANYGTRPALNLVPEPQPQRSWGIVLPKVQFKKMSERDLNYAARMARKELQKRELERKKSVDAEAGRRVVIYDANGRRKLVPFPRPPPESKPKKTTPKVNPTRESNNGQIPDDRASVSEPRRGMLSKDPEQNCSQNTTKYQLKYDEDYQAPFRISKARVNKEMKKDNDSSPASVYPSPNEPRTLKHDFSMATSESRQRPRTTSILPLLPIPMSVSPYGFSIPPSKPQKNLISFLLAPKTTVKDAPSRDSASPVPVPLPEAPENPRPRQTVRRDSSSLASSVQPPPHPPQGQGGTRLWSTNSTLPAYPPSPSQAPTSRPSTGASWNTQAPSIPNTPPSTFCNYSSDESTSVLKYRGYDRPTTTSSEERLTRAAVTRHVPGPRTSFFPYPSKYDTSDFELELTSPRPSRPSRPETLPLQAQGSATEAFKPSDHLCLDQAEVKRLRAKLRAQYQKQYEGRAFLKAH